jgi:hypothetical protein
MSRCSEIGYYFEFSLRAGRHASFREAADAMIGIRKKIKPNIKITENIRSFSGYTEGFIHA